MLNPELLKCSLGKRESFYVLKESSGNMCINEALIFLHGLGENRSGINYLFKELAQGLTKNGVTTYRFDLSGCGDNDSPLSISRWRNQLEVVQEITASYKRVHFLGRGTGSIILPKSPLSIALNPFSKEYFLNWVDKILLNLNEIDWTPIPNYCVGQDEDFFWANLGIESGCLGGFHIPQKFLEELKTNLEISAEWNIFFGGNYIPFDKSEFSYKSVGLHPLFMLQQDRELLLRELIKLLQKT